MAIAPIGTPASTHSATGSVTGTWGTGQVRNAGDLLIAAISAAATTSVTTIASASTGWTQLYAEPNTASSPHVAVAIWTKIATGTDAAPTFTSTETGTAGGMDCMLFELLGAYNASPADTVGLYGSGASTGTLTMTATTGANVTATGEVAIAVFAQEAAAANLTWVDSGTGGFTKLLNGNGSSTVLQTYVGIVDSPTASATLNDAGHFSTNTTAYGAGIVAVFALPIPTGIIVPLENYVNNCAATVTTGGTDLPSAGSSEAWSSVSVTSAFPVASAAFQFHVCDPAAPTEKMLVTACPGGTGAQSWTVTRGSESSPVVQHAAGFSVVQIVTAGVLAGMAQQQVISANGLGADPTGTVDSTSAIQTAATGLASAGVGGVITLGPGNYKVSGNIVINTAAPIYIQGAGRWATQISYTGTGACFRIYNSAQYELGKSGGGISGLTIDGTSAGAASTALHMGDILQYRVDIAVQNFTGAGDIGLHFNNQYFWTEQLTATAYLTNNTNNVVFDNAPGGAATSTGSFERGEFYFYISQSNPLYNGVIFQNSAFMANGTLRIRGNFTSSNSALTSSVLSFPGSGNSHISACNIQIGVECGYVVGTNAPYTIFFSSGSNYINRSFGYMDFSENQAFQVCNNAGCVTFSGLILGDTALAGQQQWYGTLGLNMGYYLGYFASAATIATSGTITVAGLAYVPVTCTAAVTGVILPQGANDGQVVTLSNQGSFPITFAASGTSNVFDGANDVLGAGTTQMYVYSSNKNLWYRTPQGPWTAYLATTFTGASSASAQNVTGLAAVLPIGAYTFHGYMPYESAQAAGTATFAFTFSGTAGAATNIIWMSHIVGSPYFSNSVAPSATITTASMATPTLIAGEGNWMEVVGMIQVTAAGTLQLTETQSVAADLLKVLAGSYIEFMQVG